MIIVAAALALPAFAACGGIVVAPEQEQGANGGTQVGGQGTATATTPAATQQPAEDAGSIDDTAVSIDAPSPSGSGAYPCGSSTAAYYKDPVPPPATTSGGCRDLYSPEKRHPAGCEITIVAPAGPSCFYQHCFCGESGHWEPSSDPGCNWGL